jgi:hypothetical protein
MYPRVGGTLIRLGRNQITEYGSRSGTSARQVTRIGYLIASTMVDGICQARVGGQHPPENGPVT